MNDPWLDRLARWIEKAGLVFDESMLYRYLLLGKARLGALQKRESGMTTGELALGEFFTKHIRTVDKRLHLAPPEFTAALHDAVAVRAQSAPAGSFVLISGARRLASYNSWTHHIDPLVEKLKGNWAMMKF